MINFTAGANEIIFTVRVVPRASKSEIVGEFQNALKIKIASPPVDGAANTELVKLLSKTFGISKQSVEILSGANSKIKQIKITGISRENFSKLFETNFSRKQ